MTELERLRGLFREEQLAHYDFSAAPNLITHGDLTTLVAKVRKEDVSGWQEEQTLFSRWTGRRSVFTEEYVKSGKDTYDAYFSTNGLLHGDVLDIGGGWGLYRQWWDPKGSDVFIVHDPGVERFRRGAFKLHHSYYERAFSLPMTFVEGIGEEMPYRDGTFSMCLIAAALDHVEDPQKTLSEAYRCLKPEGQILIFTACHLSKPTGQHAEKQEHAAKRMLGHVRHPLLTFSRLLGSFSKQYEHVEFSVEQVKLLLSAAGFSKSETALFPNTRDVYSFTARKSA